jgi:hypothetical protein
VQLPLLEEHAQDLLPDTVPSCGSRSQDQYQQTKPRHEDVPGANRSAFISPPQGEVGAHPGRMK